MPRTKPGHIEGETYAPVDILHIRDDIRLLRRKALAKREYEDTLTLMHAERLLTHLAYVVEEWRDLP